MIEAPRQADPRKIVPLAQVEQLGEHRKKGYVRWKGREYRLDGLDNDVSSRRPDDIVLTKSIQTMIDGYEHNRDMRIRAVRVPAGTYEALLAEDAAKRAKVAAKERPRPVSVLDIPPAGHYRRTRLRTVDEVLAAAEGAGAILRVVDTAAGPALYVELPRGWSSLGEALERVKRLVIGRLTGKPVPCELCGPKVAAHPAVTIVTFDVAACGKWAEP